MSREYAVKTKNRIGEARTMNNGQKAVIIRYRRCDDMDIRFEDGTVVTTAYSTFKVGQVKNPMYKPHVGETAFNKQGLRMTLKDYRVRKDCLVAFEDGAVRDHVSYDSFIKGSIRHPDFDKERMSKHIGETYDMHIGMKATVIAYRNRKDCDVLFENGKMGTHKQYVSVVRGEVLYDGYAEDSIAEYIGRKYPHGRSGMMMEVIGGKGETMLTVRFDDGYIKENVPLANLKRGCVTHPGYPLKQDSRLGERKLNTWGYGMTIVRYGNSSDIDVAFDDGQVAEHRSYLNFRIGNIKYPVPGCFAGFEITRAWSEGDAHYYNCRCMTCGCKDIFTPDQMLSHSKRCATHA